MGCIEEIVPPMFEVEGIAKWILDFTHVVTKGRISDNDDSISIASNKNNKITIRMMVLRKNQNKWVFFLLFCSLVILVKIFLSFNLNLFNISRFPLFGKKYQLKFANDVSAETYCLVHFPSFIRFSSYFITQDERLWIVCCVVW